MATKFGKGISVVSGFDLGAKAPVDSRYVVETIQDRDDHVTNNRAYEGMLCYVQEDKTIYRYSGSAWEAFGVTTATTITATGDVKDATVTTGVEGSGTLTLTLKEIIAGGTGCKVTVNKKGLVTKVEALAETDIPELHLAKIVDAGSAAGKTAAKTGAGNVLLIGEDGKIDSSVIPDLAISEVTVVENEEAMLGLQAQPGDIAVRNDIEKTFMLKTTPATSLENWVELKSPTDKVQSVNGKTGTVVLGTDEIEEGSTNLYYTEQRATQNFTTNFAKAKSTSLADTANLVRVGDHIKANVIDQDETHRFVSDTQIARWNDAAHIKVTTNAQTDLEKVQIGDFLFETVGVGA